MVRCLPLLTFAWLVACASPATEGVSEAASGASTAPPPFTADEIRAANPPGTERVFRVQTAGQPALLQTMRFLDGDANETRVEGAMTTLDGRPVGEPAVESHRWAELRDHAAFPVEATHRSRATCTVGAGRFDCMLYVVEELAEDGTPTTSRYYFSREHPGPPVLLEVERAGALGFRMELVELAEGS